MQILISDANILIDLEVGGLLQVMFKLSFEFCTPDVLYETELAHQHSHLITLGLTLRELSPESMIYVYRINQNYDQPSFNDLLALALAKQESCPLLTGDKRLRQAAEKEAVVVKGTIWIVEQLIIQGIISTTEARSAYLKMKDQDRRLPFNLAFDRLDNLS